MSRIIVNQECFYHESNSINFFNPKEKDNLEIRTIDLGVFNDSFNRGKSINRTILENCIKHISTDLDSKINMGKLEYSGVSLTPFIFLAAQRFKLKNIQLNDIGLWHNFRNPNLGIDKHGWCLLNNVENIPMPQLKRRWGNTRSAHNDEIVITFSTSFPIDEKNWVEFNFQRFRHYHFQSEFIKDFDVDSVFSRKQAQIYANDVHNFLLENSSYTKINLVISSSVAMTFCLAYKLLNENYSNEITVYHYDKQQNPCRPWGITFNNNSESKAVINY